MDGLVSFFKQVTPSGIIVGSLVPLITLYFNHFLSRQRTSEERKASFRLKVYELRIQAAQTAYQYAFKLYRAGSRTTKIGQLLVVNKPKVDISDLQQEARDWLDGQALILGDKIYQAVFFYFNSVGEQGQYKAMEKAQKVLRGVIKEDLVDPKD